jgi:hypothetical protein
MSDLILLEKAAQDLEGLLAQMSLGETVTLSDADGKPLALLVSLNSEAPKPDPDPDWLNRWEALAQEISAASPGERSLLEDLAEMRR